MLKATQLARSGAGIGTRGSESRAHALYQFTRLPGRMMLPMKMVMKEGKNEALMTWQAVWVARYRLILMTTL